MKRYLQLDALRGLFLIIMALDHFRGPFRFILYERIGFFTAAEGFIFLSGIVAGLVYSRYEKPRILFMKTFNRIFVIYKYQLIAIITMFLIINIFKFYNDFWIHYFSYFTNFSIIGLLSSLILLYEPYLTDILPLYIFMIFLMPFLLLILQNGHKIFYWGIIICLWFIGVLFGHEENFFQYELLRTFPVDLGHFNYFSWQILFFIGLYFGYKKQIDHNFNLKLNYGFVLLALAIIIILFVLNNCSYLGCSTYFIENVDANSRLLFNKSNLGIGRIINFLAFSYLVSLLLIKFKKLLTHPWLVLLGQNSIKVYTAHILSAIIFYPMIPYIKNHGPFWHVLFSLTMLLPLFLVVIIEKSKKQGK